MKQTKQSILELRSLSPVFAARTRSDVTKRDRFPARLTEFGGVAKATQAAQSWIARVRSGEHVLDSVILVLLAALLLPLVVGPFIVAYEFAIHGQYAAALFIVCLFGCLALVAIRAVRRGEFGPGVLFFGIGLLAGAALLGAALSKLAEHVLGGRP